jgi:hypothetical protein
MNVVVADGFHSVFVPAGIEKLAPQQQPNPV